MNIIVNQYRVEIASFVADGKSADSDIFRNFAKNHEHGADADSVIFNVWNRL